MIVPKKILILFIQISFCIVGFAQREKVDSLKKVLPSLHDSARVDCLNEIFSNYYWQQMDSFGYYAYSAYNYYALPAYEESIKINYIHGIAEAVSNKAMIKSPDYPEAEKLARQSLAWYDKTSDKRNIASTFFILGFVLYCENSFDEAITYLKKSYDCSKKGGDEIKMFIAKETIGSCYMASGDYDNALKVYRACLQLTPRINNDFYIMTQLQFLARLYRNIDDYVTALSYYRQAYQRLKPAQRSRSAYNYGFDYLGFAELFSLQHQFDSARYYFNFIDTTKYLSPKLLMGLGEYYFLQHQYDKALSYGSRALSYLYSKLHFQNWIMRSLFDVARIYSATQNKDSSFYYAKQGLILAQRTGARQFIMEGYHVLYSAYDIWHEVDSAYFYYRLYITMKDSILNDQIKGKLIAYSYEQRIELLDKEKEIQQANLQKQSLIRNILIAGTLVLLLLGAFIFRNSILKRKNEKSQREIAENELQIQKLESERTKAELQQQATELEMQALRAQMNPHFIFNSLNSINRFILQNNKAEASEYLTKFSRLVRLILQNSQAPLITLQSELESLELYFEMEALRFDYHFAYKISVPKELDSEVLKVPPLILQPYVENAIWHGLMHKEEKGQLDIEVSQENDHLFFKITDNGIGRKQSAVLASKSATKHKSIGLKITAQRIAMLQSFDSTSRVTINDLVAPDGKAAGTEIIIKIPIMYD